MIIDIDKNSGFCFGVVYAVSKADEYLEKNNFLYCLGDIVHNDMEVSRLQKKGLKIINFETFKELKNQTVLIRAHGEPPQTYNIARQNNIKLIDASCPIVLRLQLSIKKYYNEMKKKQGQIVIYGKKGHAEVIGLSGQTNNEAIIVSNIEDLNKIDYSRPIALFSQTTKSSYTYHKIINEIKKRLLIDDFFFQDSVCKQVSNRDKEIREFSKNKDIVIFISGKKSSNGKMLYNVCKNVNPNTKFVSELEEISPHWFKKIQTVGICGATSTPSWLMLKAKNLIENFEKNKF
jgi:4-hydroxy-3-methylbut-2-enyl diphosphate reductase